MFPTVFEYIPDSEEASQSQPESIMSGGSHHERKDVSEDELEFLERTQAFIANMQKLRQEIRDEQVEEEEIEMTEHHEVRPSFNPSILLSLFKKKNFDGHMSFHVTTDTPILEFWAGFQSQTKLPYSFLVGVPVHTIISYSPKGCGASETSINSPSNGLLVS